MPTLASAYVAENNGRSPCIAFAALLARRPEIFPKLITIVE